MKHIALVIMMIILLSGCSRERTYKEVSKEFLKRELSHIDDKKNCLWHYGRKDGYHLFSLMCTKDYDSFLRSKKNYKIKTSKLKVITPRPITGEPFGAVVSTGDVEIKW